MTLISIDQEILFKYLLALFLIGVSFKSYSQKISHESSYFELQKPCPEVVLNDLHFYSVNKINLSKLRGRWVILDFWNRHCTSCISSFPSTNNLQQKYNDKLQVFLIGYTGSQYFQNSDDMGIRQDYDKYRKDQNLNLPVDFDSTLFHRFKIGPCPYIVVIDPNGKVKGITYKLTAEDVNKFIAGQDPILPKAWGIDENTISYNSKSPFLINENGGHDTDYLCRSLISKWKDYMPYSAKYEIEDNKLQILGVDLSSLYKFAFIGKSEWDTKDSLYGRFYPFPILELKDSSLFIPDLDLRNNMFCYSLESRMRKNDKISFLKMMQRDLQNYFNYTVTIEDRKMPYWQLIKSKKIQEVSSAKYRTKRFLSLKYLLTYINSNNRDQPPFLNETGIENINILLNCRFDDIEDIKRSLQENGFNLVKGEKTMKVLIISDAQ